MDTNWKWGPKLKALYDKHGLNWEVRKIPNNELGSSPGDVLFYGETHTVVIEPNTWIPWVAHELAHYLVCKRDNPEFLRLKNYGFEREGAGEGGWDDKTESLACIVQTALLIQIGYPWRKAADEVNIVDDFWPPNIPFLRTGAWSHWERYKSEAGWAAVRKGVLKVAQPYTEGV